MARARGANTIMQLGFEGAYAVPPNAGSWIKTPFVTHNLGEEQGLIQAPDLGYGRERLDPDLDVANDEGDLVVGVDVRGFGHWLKLHFGPATTVGSVAPTGALTFAGQPAVNSTVTINGTVFTFKASGSVGNQSDIGVNLAATLTALAGVLNGSGVAGVAAATYSATATKLMVTHDTLGIAGNAFTLAASGPSQATPSGATLSGGANTHTFLSGAQDLPSAAIEFWHPEVPQGFQHIGLRGGGLKIALARQGMLNATLNLVARGEEKISALTDGAPSEIVFDRFSQFTGEVSREGVALAHVMSAEWSYMNDLEKIDVIRRDGRIEDADPGFSTATGSIVTRFADMTLYDQATNNTPCAMTFGWSKGPSANLLVTQPRVWLPKVKRPVTGPTGIQATQAWQASVDEGLGYGTKVALTNDVAGYA